MANKINIVIADDYELLRAGFRMIIDSQDDMKTVGEASDGREAVRLALELAPDVVLMDIGMPNLNGLKATAQLKRMRPEMKVLILTRHTDSAYVREMTLADGNGYVLKQSPSAELLQAVRSVAAGEAYLDPAITANVLDHFAELRTPAKSVKPGVPLTTFESDVLHYIARGFSNNEIADRLNVSVRSVETYKSNATRKLGIKSRREIIQYALSQGWLREC